MYRGYKVRLKLTKNERNYVAELFAISRKLYNDSLRLLDNYYKEYKSLLDPQELRNYFSHFVMNNEDIIKKFPIETLQNVLNTVYIKFKKKIDDEKVVVKYKSTLGSYDSLLLGQADYKVEDERLILNLMQKNKISKRGMKFYETGYFPKKGMRINPHLCFDGIDYYFSTVVKVPEVKKERMCCVESLGIDIGIKNFCTFSNGQFYPNINKTEIVKRLNRQANYYQSRMSQSRLISKKTKKPLSHNFYKLHNLYLKTMRKIVRIRTNYIYLVVKDVVEMNPKYVCIEDLAVKEMIHDSDLAKYIFEATFRKFRTVLEYKCKWNGITICVANRYYPSSKVCSNCGCVIQDLSLSDRVYKCPHCHTEIDRDLNAAINLSRIPKSIKMSSPDQGRHQQSLSENA